MNNYLITGGAGFIGSHLTDALIAQGHKVVVLDNFSVGSYKHPEADYCQADLLDFKAVKPLFKDIDGCFHLAAIPSVVMSMEQWFDFHRINLEGSLNLFKLAHLAGNIPVIYASSCAVYGYAKQLPLTEDRFIQPISSYGCDKLAVEINAYFMAHSYSLPVMGLRFFNVYGPRQNPISPYSGVISKFVHALLQGQKPIIYGDGLQTRDFIYVEDVVTGLMKAMSQVKADAKVLNLCTGHPVTINDLLSEIASIMDKKYCVDFQEERIFDVMHSQGSTVKMHELGFQARVDRALGLKKTIDYMLKHR